MARQSAGPVSLEWRVWAVENLVLGVDEDRILEALARAGVDAALGRSMLDKLKAHPYVRAARRAAWQGQKALSLLDLYGRLHRLQAPPRQVERRVNVSAAEFFERYYCGHRPVILTGRMADWPALRKWTPMYFREVVGDAVVEITAGRESDPDHDLNREKHRQWLTMRELVDRVTSGGVTNDYYLMGRGHAWASEGLRPLHGDVRVPEDLLASSDARRTGEFFWFGPAGTVTRLHHDALSVFIAQVYGRKHVKLIPSFDLAYLYNHRSWFSRVDPERAEPERYPAFQKASVSDVILEPGEMLFIPVGWWHWVRALDVSVSMSFRRFRVPGENTLWIPPEQPEAPPTRTAPRGGSTPPARRAPASAAVRPAALARVAPRPGSAAGRRRRRRPQSPECPRPPRAPRRPQRG